MTKQQPDEWTNCYNSGWGDLLIPAAYSHPAKMARSLVFKIVAHALEEGWIQPGQWILDPFGGVGTTALPSLMAGLNYIGVELEPRFVELGRQNIALWNSRFSGMPRWTGEAILLQGDSRRLAEVVRAAGLVVGSPPYVGGGHHNDQTGAWGGAIGTGQPTGKDKSIAGYGQGNGQMGQMKEGDISAVISSPPFAGNTGGRGEASRNGIDAALFDRHSGGMKKGTGSDPANLDHLKMGQGPGVGGQVTVISSPPYVDSMEKSGGIDPDKSDHIGGPHSQMNRSDTRYGQTDGQLGAMKVHPEPSRRAGEVTAVVGSPPFENSLAGEPRNDNSVLGQMQRGDNRTNGGRFGKSLDNGYSNDPANIGINSGQTFWEAAALIVGQCYQILPPNGIAIWVVKNYIKSGREVDFTGQWQALCEACGFETVHIHRAMLVKHQGVQQGAMEGTAVSLEVSRKSFFRRLSERRGSPPIDFETILCTRKAA